MNKTILILLFIAMITNVGHAQLPQGFFGVSPNQIIVEKAVEKGVILFRQDFQLLDTVSNILYGRNNQEMFGSKYSIAYKLKNKCIVSDEFVNPWQYDENFRKIENNTYLPIVSSTLYRNITDSTMKIMNYRAENCKSITDDVMCYTDNINNGFSIETTNGEKDGWIVWIQYSEPLSESTKVSIVTHKHKVKFEKGIKEYELKNLNKTESHVCGFYVIPYYLKIGVVDFMFGGIINKKDNKWILVRLDDEAELPEIVNKTEPEIIQITPIEDNIEVKNFPNSESNGSESVNQNAKIEEQ